MANRSRRAAEPPTGSTTDLDFELTDEQWSLISDLFPQASVGPQVGRPPIPPRACVEGIIWILRSGARWKDLPARFPSATTCWRRHNEWSESGIWQRAWARLVRLLDRRGRVNDEEAMADATFSPAKKGVKRSARRSEAREPRSSYLLMPREFLLVSTPPVRVPTK